MVSPGRAELSLLSGKVAFFVLVFMSGAAKTRDGRAAIPRNASPINSSDGERTEGLCVVFKGTSCEQFRDRIGVVFKEKAETCPDLFVAFYVKNFRHAILAQ